MSYTPKDMTGTIRVNDRKEKETHPDRKGSALIDGTEYWISGWLKKDKNGEPYLSLAFKAKDTETKPKDGGLSGARKPAASEPDDSIPF